MNHRYLSLVIAASAAMPSLAHAEVTGSVSAAVRLDDNVFALPVDDQPAGTRRSDTIASTSANLDATLHPVGTTIDLTAGATYEAYQHNTAYDNFGYQFGVAALADPGQRFSIGGSALARRSLSSFASLGVPVRNIQTLENVSPTFAYTIAGEIALVFKPIYDRSTNSATYFDSFNYQRYGASVGLGLHTPLGNQIDLTVGQRETKGLGARLINVGDTVIDQPTNLRDRSVDLKLIYQVTPATSINATATYLWRRDFTVLAHNLSAPFGELGVRYAPGPRLQVTADLGFRLETLDQIFVDSVRTVYGTVAARVDLSDRIRVIGRVDYSRRKFQADNLATVNNLSINTVDRTEHLQRYELGVTYGLTRHFAISANVAHERRTSQYQFYNFKQTIGQFSLMYLFGESRDQRSTPGQALRY